MFPIPRWLLQVDNSVNLSTVIIRYDLMSGKKEFLVNGSAHNEIYSVEFDYNRDVLFWADQDTDSVMVGAC